MATSQTRRYSWELAITPEQSRERMASFAKAQAWKLTWRKNDFMLSMPENRYSLTLYVASGELRAEGEASRLVFAASSLADRYVVVVWWMALVFAATYKLVQEDRTWLSDPVLLASPLLCAVFVAWLFVSRRIQRKRLDLFVAAMNDVRVSAPDAPFR